MASIRNLAERAPGAFSSACKFLSIGSSPTAARRIASPVLTISPPGPVNCWPATVKHSRSARISSAVRRTCPSPYRAALASSGAAGTAAAYTQPEWLCATASMTELYAWRLSGSPALRLSGSLVMDSSSWNAAGTRAGTTRWLAAWTNGPVHRSDGVHQSSLASHGSEYARIAIRTNMEIGLPAHAASRASGSPTVSCCVCGRRVLACGRA
jgi:hypothetical protein